MGAIYQWISQLLVLIVLMALSDLLLPANSWRPFVRLVLGSLLLLLLLEPLIYFVRQNDELLTVSFPLMEEEIQMQQEEGELIISDMNNKHQSYIWKEVADQLTRQAKPIVQENFGVELSTVTVWPHNSTIETFTGEIEVVLHVTPITEVDNHQLIKLLAGEWGVPDDSIRLVLKEE
ncbi:stage III sporulation protein AF [Jeotgalibacillus soli]|uniref:Stage III sporulation protein AF n=1 Tax=Jeotgalibacillus soli TaxID=889306 RepID=A0A0C2V5U4_9BACL|nr:stage III sporulation protein AF [Jeotgalibacillus soli]KIL44362.1 hypothetical protein KP78_33260 [Jeotgalibacillus soli]